MQLEKLNPELLTYKVIPKTVRVLSAHGYDFDAMLTDTRTEVVNSIEECSGIRFLCPACLQQGLNHVITRWSHERGAPFFASPIRYRWKINGTSLADICVVPDFENEMSLEREDVCGWNGFVQNGEALL